MTAPVGATRPRVPSAGCQDEEVGIVRENPQKDGPQDPMDGNPVEMRRERGILKKWVSNQDLSGVRLVTTEDHEVA